ncbi:MAG TPA: glutamine-hydrolyzing GMP synthase [Verrucomicrobiae bacterium]|nr:glutamine-hydrolyzing GMP synthase [Verrucomicrobiae bacterium]
MEVIGILDFGSQYTQVIARRVRECGVYTEIFHHATKARVLRERGVRGIILSGGPASVYARRAPKMDPAVLGLGVPVLGICYGLQMIGKLLGGAVARSDHREYGKGTIKFRGRRSELLVGVTAGSQIWNSHGDRLERLPEGFRVAAVSENSPYAAVEDTGRRIFGLQFHPEVSHTPEGKRILSNFAHRICGCRSEWTMRNFIEHTCESVRAQVGRGRVILGLSGGVDSSVAAALLHEAIGDQLHCIFVDNGLLRKNEARLVEQLFGKHMRIRLKCVDASKGFLRLLRGVTDPERKRKIIGNEFIRVFERAKRSVGRARFLAQGTLYPDVIESVSIGGNPAALIKSHHNVGGLPKDMDFELVEPLRQLFKDEVRRVGEELGLPREIVWRQPFPGPGLAVRCLGEITPEKLEILRNADWVVIDEMKSSGWYGKVWQSFAVLLPVRSVGVMGDERSYDYTIAVRVVESQDGMTADWVKLPYELLGRISSRIINEVKGVNRVTFDITSKPPGTIEWE